MSIAADRGIPKQIILSVPIPSKDVMSIEQKTAHEHYSVSCFNDAWELLDRSERTVAETQQLIHLAHASLYHWTERDDVTVQNMAIGYWFLSRVYAHLGQAYPAMTNAELALGYSQGLEPFYLAYAHEAIARAASLSKDRKLLKAHMILVQELLPEIEDDNDRTQIINGLSTID